MKQFYVTVQTVREVRRFIALAFTAVSAYESAAPQTDEAFGITVLPV